MKFYESGLPDSKLVEEAFDYSAVNTMSNQKDALKNFSQQVVMMHSQNMMMLDAEKRMGSMSEDEYDKQKKMLEKMRDDQMNAGPMLISEELGKMFVAKRVAPAKEIADHCTNAAPELIAAVLLIDCVRSPIDYQNIEKKFGSAVAGLIAEVVHIDAYPSERDTNLAKAGADTKRAYMSLLITSLDQIVEQIKRSSAMNPMHQAMFPPGQEEQLYSNAKLMWGNDAKLDARFVESFNKASEAASSVFKLEVDASGELELVKGAPPSPKGPAFKPRGPKPPGGKGGDNGGLGGDVF